MKHPLNFRLLFVRIYMLMVGLALGLGGVILMGEEDRFSGPAFAGPRNLVAWFPCPAWVLWGLLFVVYALILVAAVGRDWATHALRFGLVVYTFFVISLLTSLFPEPTAALTGIAAYTILALLHLVLADHVYRDGWEI